MKPAPASSTSVSASSPMMSALAQRRTRMPARARAAALLEHFVDVCLRHVQRRGEAEDHAGPEADGGEIREDAGVHRELDPVRLADVLARVEQPDARERPARGRARRRSAASSRLSISSCRTMRQRVAPSDTRTDISRARFAARANSRLATLAHAISSTNADRAQQREKDHADRTAVLLLVERLHPRSMSLLVSGYSRREPFRDGEQLRLRLRTSGVLGSRPNTRRAARVPLLLLEIRIAASGCHRSAFCGNLKPSGMTPTITAGTSLTRTVRPITHGSLP